MNLTVTLMSESRQNKRLEISIWERVSNWHVTWEPCGVRELLVFIWTGYTGVYICENSYSCPLKICVLYCFVLYLNLKLRSKVNPNTFHLGPQCLWEGRADLRTAAFQSGCLMRTLPGTELSVGQLPDNLKKLINRHNF